MSNYSVDMHSIEAAAGASPKNLYLLFILQLTKTFFESAINESPQKVERATLALISCAVPEESRRTELWRMYEAVRDAPNGNEYGAACRVIGFVVQSLTETLGLTSEDMYDIN